MTRFASSCGDPGRPTPLGWGYLWIGLSASGGGLSRCLVTEPKAAVWLSLSRAAFDGCSALELAREESGYRLVMQILERIAYGYCC